MRISLITILCLLIAFSSCKQTPKKIDVKPKKPKYVIVVLADDLGYGDLGCYGATAVKTPNIDELTFKGTKFTDAHSSSSVCTPSRYSLMTGRYCWRTSLKRGVLGGFDQPLIEDERETIADIFKNAGYNTAMVGKWHLGLGWSTKDNCVPFKNGVNIDYEAGLSKSPLDCGFDSWFGISASLDFPPYCFINNNAIEGKIVSLKEVRYDSQRSGLQVANWDDTQVDSIFFEKAKTYLSQQIANDNKAFLYLATAAPHRPCAPPAFVDGSSKAGRRGDMIELFDWGIGQLVECLKANDVLDESLIVITSDNGGRPGDGENPMDIDFYKETTQLPNRAEADVFNHGAEKWVSYGHKSNGKLKGYKTDLYEGGHRIPFIMYWPQRKMFANNSNLVCLTDLFSTFSDMLGITMKDESGEDSVSFLECLNNHNSSRKSIVHHSARGYFSYRKDNLKYLDCKKGGGVTRFEDEPEEYKLYNLEKDITEENNLIKDNSQIVDEFKNELEQVKKGDDEKK